MARPIVPEGPVEVDAGRHVDGDADVLIAELGLHAEAAGEGGAGVEGAGGDGDLGADLERGLLAVGGADADLARGPVYLDVGAPELPGIGR